MKNFRMGSIVTTNNVINSMCFKYTDVNEIMPANLTFIINHNDNRSNSGVYPFGPDSLCWISYSHIRECTEAEKIIYDKTPFKVNDYAMCILSLKEKEYTNNYRCGDEMIYAGSGYESNKIFKICKVENWRGNTVIYDKDGKTYYTFAIVPSACYDILPLEDKEKCKPSPIDNEESKENKKFTVYQQSILNALKKHHKTEDAFKELFPEFYEKQHEIFCKSGDIILRKGKNSFYTILKVGPNIQLLNIQYSDRWKPTLSVHSLKNYGKTTDEFVVTNFEFKQLLGNVNPNEFMVLPKNEIIEKYGKR